MASSPTRVNSLRSNSTLGRRRGHASGSDLFIEVSVFPWGADHFLKTGETIPAGRLRHARARLRRRPRRRLRRPARPGRAARGRDPARHAPPPRPFREHPSRARARRLASSRFERRAPPTWTSSSSARTPKGPTRAADASTGAGTSDEEAVEEDVTTRRGVERICRAAFAFATTFEKPRRLGRRPRVLMADKHNVQKRGGGLWHRVFREVAAEFPSCESRHMFADALAHEMVRRPGLAGRRRHEQPLRRRPFRSRRRPAGRPRPRAVRERAPGQDVRLRARPRLGSGPRGQGNREPVRVDPEPRDAARPRRPRGSRRAHRKRRGRVRRGGGDDARPRGKALDGRGGRRRRRAAPRRKG